LTFEVTTQALAKLNGLFSWMYEADIKGGVPVSPQR